MAGPKMHEKKVVSKPPASDSFFTDAQVDEMCEGLTQPAAMIRYLRSLGLRVDRKPNGRPLAWRPAVAAATQAQNAPSGPNVVGLQQWASRRKHGTQSQGR
ncbi:MAG: hypothetical protein V4844_22270 [Pseudomonadota bacterium]